MNTFLDKTAGLTPTIRHILYDKSTEAPYSGHYNAKASLGSYLCRRCGLALFRAHSQFSSGCGWPSFDERIAENVKQTPDSDGHRIEILCNRCDSHLGHVFFGEGFTQQNCRYCVNSASIDFVENSTVIDSEEAIFAGGCFWGVDYFLRRAPGVLKVEVGYSGGTIENPSYEEVCSGTTGHYEAIRVLFDVAKTDYYAIAKRFFEIHDPTQDAGQGPDVGQQYQSAIFYYDEKQLKEAKSLIKQLKEKGYEPKTRLLPAQIFWPAEDYHQDYYTKHNKVPYCHQPIARFGDA